MEFSIQREDLLSALQLVSGVVDRKQPLPILSNILIEVTDNNLSITATDLEVELIVYSNPSEVRVTGKTTVSAKKLSDICKNLPSQSLVDCSLDKNRFIIQSHNNRFELLTLPSEEYPYMEHDSVEHEISINEGHFRALLEKTYFSMAHQDVRYYLNGLLLDINEGNIKSIATDGHRLALSSAEITNNKKPFQVIIPRKGVIELLRLLTHSDNTITISIEANCIRLKTETFAFSSKLLEGAFPDYNRVIPKAGDKTIIVEKDHLKQIVAQVAVLSHDKYRGIRAVFAPEQQKMLSNNAENEGAEVELTATYEGEKIEIALNVNYLQEALNAIESPKVKITLSSPSSSILMTGEDEASDGYPARYIYVIMPMRL
jgi:DNA polymerase III subunit beta